MRVTFPRLADHERSYAVIERDDGVIYQLFSGRATRELPHDLRHLIVERELRIGDGIWGAIAAGAVYERVRPRTEMLASLVEAVAALDRPTPDAIGRLTRQKLSVVPLQRPGSDPVTVIGVPPPAVLAAAASALQVEAARWARLRTGEELVYQWLLARSGPVT